MQGATVELILLEGEEEEAYWEETNRMGDEVSCREWRRKLKEHFENPKGKGKKGKDKGKGKGKDGVGGLDTSSTYICWASLGAF